MKSNALILNCLVHDYFRQLVQSRDRIANGLKKLLETNDLVAKMEVPLTA